MFKTLESPLNSEEIKPVNPKGIQSGTFIGRTDAEAKSPILWPPDAKNWLIGKDPNSGKDWRQEEKGTDDRGWDGWMAPPTRWTCVWVGSGNWWWNGKTGVLQSMGLQRVELDWVTELIWSCEEVGKYEICYCRWFRQSAQALFFSSKLPMGISCWHVAPIINSRTMWGKQTSSGTQGKKSKTNCLLKHTLV